MRLRVLSASFIAIAVLTVFITVGCDGNVAQPIGYGQPVQSFGQPHVTIRSASVPPNAFCPLEFSACYTVSASHTIRIPWCYGPSSQPCEDTNQWTWSGIVCTEKGPPCRNIKTEEMSAKWSGPFNCVPSVCGRDIGTYVLDAITTEKGIKQTKLYIYEQDIHICESYCKNFYSGLNVGP
jgi:hypothetical protein